MPKIILVVDDDESNRDILTYVLRQAGYHILEAEHGEEALVIARTEKPDLVITDLNMPVMNGARFVSELRADPDPTIANIPVVMATAHEEAVTLARALGINYLMPFSPDPDAMVAVVEAALATIPGPLNPDVFSLLNKISSLVETIKTFTHVKL